LPSSPEAVAGGNGHVAYSDVACHSGIMSKKILTGRPKAQDQVLFDPEVIFERMAESAFDFLKKSRENWTELPKYSIINFATAIELILKARLIKEHWSLIIAPNSEADQRSFMSGNCKTVTPDEAMRRLDKIVGDAIPKAARDAFGLVAAHRNRSIHFFHDSEKTSEQGELLVEVSAEQLTAWFHILKLLKKWDRYFSDYRTVIGGIEREMKRLRAFLRVTYEGIADEIAEKKAKGVDFSACSSCGFEAAVLSELTDKVTEASCLVCNLDDVVVVMKCPGEDCPGTIRLTSWDTANESCEVCEEEISKAQLVDFLDTEAHDFSDPSTAKNCANCTSMDSVVEHENLYVCTECLTYDDELSLCDWCNELQMGGGKLQNSYASGCEFCDGRTGWERD